MPMTPPLRPLRPLSALSIALAALLPTVAHADAPDACAATTVLHVAPDSETPTGNGSSWSTPTSLTAALAQANGNYNATQCFELRLKQGIYRPQPSADQGPHTAPHDQQHFLIDRPLQLKGGYTGNIAQPDERTLYARNTVISGDLDGDDLEADANNGVTVHHNKQVGTNSSFLLKVLPHILALSHDASAASYTLIEGLTFTGAQQLIDDLNPQNNKIGNAVLCAALPVTHSGCTFALRHVHIEGNGGIGLAIDNLGYAPNSAPDISHAVFSGNYTGVNLHSVDGTLASTLTHTTFYANTGLDIRNISIHATATATLHLRHSTLGDTGGMDIYGIANVVTNGGTSQIYLDGNILWYPSGIEPVGEFNHQGSSVIQLRNNVVRNAAGAPESGNVAIDPQLGPLQDNGGPTWTRLPANLDVVDAVACDATGSTLTTDQRGAPRPIGARCDLGAVELGQFAVTPHASGQGSLTCNVSWSTPSAMTTTVCTATPVSGYHTASISGCGGTATGARVNTYSSGILTDACTVSATFAADSAPDAPTLANATPGNGSVTLTWSAPANNGGNAITGYTATADAGGTAAGTCSGSAIATSCTITGLTNGTQYSFSVVATNAVGDSLASNAVTATPSEPATVPDAPTALSATPGDGAVTLTWAAPANNGGNAITGYTVTGTPGGTCTGDASATSCTVSGLTNGTAYSFSVVATNAIGDSVASNAATATPLAPPTVLPIPGGNGSASVQISGGPNTCAVVPNSLSINSSPPDAPAGAVFPMGVLHFEANGCANATLTVNITYSSPIPEAAVPHKYGPPSAGAVPSWFVPSAVTMSNDRRTVSFTVTDNGEGDNNLTLGQIRDPFGPVILASGVAAVPTLAQWGVMLLSVLTAALGAGALRSRRVRHT